MYTIHEGDIVFKEKYGSSNKSRTYVKPPGKHKQCTTCKKHAIALQNSYLSLGFRSNKHCATR